VSGLVEVEIGDVLQGLERLQLAGRDLRPVWKVLRPIIREDLAAHFADEAGPEAKWAPPSKAYMERFLKRRGMVVKKRRFSRVQGRVLEKGELTRQGQRKIAKIGKLGRLKNAWRFTVTALMFEARNMVRWSGVHQDGGAVGRGAKVPARPFAWFSDRVLDRFVVEAKKLLQAAWAP
jgi:phage gpG-like protein